MRYVARAMIAVISVALSSLPSVVDAGSANSVCALNYYCINKQGVAFGYTGTSMYYGWRHYPGNASSGTIYAGPSDMYSNGGGAISNVGTIRNRNNITGRMMCTIDFVAGYGFVLGSRKASWYNDYWVNVFSGDGAGFYWPNSTTNC